MRRSEYDYEWADEVFRRYQRRRNLPFRQLEAAWNDLLIALVGPAVEWLDRQLRRSPRLYEWLSK